MAWKDVTTMSQRLEFVVLASAEGVNVSELCRRFGVSRKTGYKWLSRYAAEGSAGWWTSLVGRWSQRPSLAPADAVGPPQQHFCSLDRQQSTGHDRQRPSPELPVHHRLEL